MTIEQIVDIPASRRLHLDFDLPFSLPAGKARVEVTVIPDELPAVREPENQEDANFPGLAMRSDIGEIPAGAEKIWAWNHAHPEEVKNALRKLRGSFSTVSFGGMDGVTYQRAVRDE